MNECKHMVKVRDAFPIYHSNGRKNLVRVRELTCGVKSVVLRWGCASRPLRFDVGWWPHVLVLIW